jgi:D-alanyl-lipoteichoic acid acyltransferase DltB (MBOAT superfamily)
MAFNSLHFLLFLPIVTALAWMLRRCAIARICFLLAASYYFYMSWNVWYAGLILGSTLLDYFAALGMGRSSYPLRRRALLVVSLAGNLGVLVLFKYHNFFMDNVAAVFGWHAAALHHRLLLPVGISFYTFQTLSYTIDVYRGRIEPTRSFLKFALFVSFFPQLVAGPIVRAADFLPQLDRAARYDDRAAEEGLRRILAGLIKKVCIADVLGLVLVDPVFADPARQSGASLLVGMYAYAFQIYYDFVGYSDVAIGAAAILGFSLPINFDRPFTATSMRDLWRRWHISLSSWLRDYLYIPLGGGRGTTLATARNLAIVMVLGGLWHGAAWGFVLWGALHGLLLGIGRWFQQVTGIDPDRSEQPSWARVLRMAFTFHLVAGCFLVFRAERFETLWTYLSAMLLWQPGPPQGSSVAWVALAVAMLWEWCPRGWVRAVAKAYLRLPAPAQACVVTACLLVFAVIGGAGTPFIYFQF